VPGPDCGKKRWKQPGKKKINAKLDKNAINAYCPGKKKEDLADLASLELNFV